jgi:hypothetical protein
MFEQEREIHAGTMQGGRTMNLHIDASEFARSSSRPLGFGGVEKVAEFFNLSKKVVRHKAQAGEWPSYVVDGKRIFNLDRLVDQLIQGENIIDQSKEASQ